MDVMLFDLCIHILIIHAPDVVFVETERTVNDLVAVACQASGKADIGRAVQQDSIAWLCTDFQGGKNTAEHAVFVADAFPCQKVDAVAFPLPADDRIEIFVSERKVAKCRVLHSLNDGLLNRRSRRKIHIGHPHWNHVKSFLWCTRCKAAGSDCINGNRIFFVTVHDRRKIVFHKIKILPM